MSGFLLASLSAGFSYLSWSVPPHSTPPLIALKVNLYDLSLSSSSSSLLIYPKLSLLFQGLSYLT